MTSTASGNGSAHSLSAGPSSGGNGSSGGGGMDELLPLVLQLTNAESVSIMTDLRYSLSPPGVLIQGKTVNSLCSRFAERTSRPLLVAMESIFLWIELD